MATSAAGAVVDDAHDESQHVRGQDPHDDRVVRLRVEVPALVTADHVEEREDVRAEERVAHERRAGRKKTPTPGTGRRARPAGLVHPARPGDGGNSRRGHLRRRDDRNQPTTSRMVATMTGERRPLPRRRLESGPRSPNDDSICEPYLASMSGTVRTVGSRRNTSRTQRRCTEASRCRSNWKYIAAGTSAATETSTHWAMWPTSSCQNAGLLRAPSRTRRGRGCRAGRARRSRSGAGR